jgi:GT2 family glycosyltransferase
LIDRWGYPFALGRVFDCLEIDSGQYADAGPLAWASGCCLAGSTDTFRDLGGFEESFFAHFEEIDLCWRYRRSGGRIRSVPGAVVHHLGASTLPVGTRKTYLNFRNNIWTLRRNLPAGRAIGIILLRALLDTAAVLRWLLGGQPATALAAVRGWWAGLLQHPWREVIPPRSVQHPQAGDGVYRGCLPWARWIRGIRRAAVLLPRTRGWEQAATGSAEGKGD